MKFARKTDIIIICLILLVSAAIWFYYSCTLAKSPAVAEIYEGSQLIETVVLKKGEKRKFSVLGHEDVIFSIDDGSICFASSDCPDKLCVRAGKLKKAGERAVCLPNRLILKIVPLEGTDADIDIITG
ncbi:MAG: NusG domain II-containing protein [Hydrogenoanaerobacterium sp.]